MVKTRTITDYREIDGIVTNLQANDKFLVARQDAYEYWSLSWGHIFDNYINIKADLVPHDHPLENFGIVKINNQGVVTDVKELEASDIPDIAMNQVFGLVAELERKTDKDFAQATSHYVVGYIKASVQDREFTESGHLVPAYINIEKTTVSPNGGEPETTNTKIKSKDGSIRYEKDPVTGDILVYVDNAVTAVQADWAQTNEHAKDYIKNKPELAEVATTGSYNSLKDKLDFKSNDEATLTITKDSTSNKYTFNVPRTEWGHIEGDINGQQDLINKFGLYYTAEQVNELLADFRGILHVKGYICRYDPSLSTELEVGTLWLRSSTTSDPREKQFLCYRYKGETSSGRSDWEDILYSAADFDVWINLNGTETNSFFWLGTKWEQLDFTFDLSNYYTKDIVDSKLALKQDKISGNAGQVVTYTETPGELGSTQLANVATTGDYADLINKPAPIQSSWSQTDYTKPDYIIDKPLLADVATTGDYNDLINKPEPVPAQVQSDWDEIDATQPSFIKNKPVIKDPEKVDITEKFLTFAEYNVNDHSYNISMSEIPNNEFFHEVLWNGVLIRENYEYIFAVDGTYYQTSDIEVDTELDTFFISTRRYSTFYPISERAIQTDWSIKASSEEESGSSAPEGSIRIVSEVDTKTISIYENEELITTLSTDDTQPDFYQNMLYTGSMNYVITEVVGAPESNIIGKITTGKLLLLGDSYPEPEDTTDIFTLKFYVKS